jgi:putative membrane protein
MSPKLKEFLQGWIITTLAVLVTSYVLSSGIHYQKPLDLIIASLLLGILNAVVRPFLILVSFPLLLLTLGLFTLVINGILLYVVSALMRPHFEVESFKYAFWGAVLISLFSMILNALTGTGKSRVQVRKGTPPPSPPPDDNSTPGSGPIIDV